MKSTMPEIDLRNHFLISMPHMSDKNFTHTLTYICDHTEQGVMGIVINRPMALSLHEVLGQLDLDAGAMKDPKAPVYRGGPVQEDRGFVLHSPAGERWSSSHPVSSEIHMSTSLDVLESIASGVGPARYLVALGYAGWGAGQLEREISENSWLSCPADVDIMFDVHASDRLGAAASILGVNLDLLSSQSGHA